VNENKGQEEIFEPALKKAGITVNRIVIPSKDYIPKINTLAAAKESLEIWGFGGNYMDYWARGLSCNQSDFFLRAYSSL